MNRYLTCALFATGALAYFVAEHNAVGVCVASIVIVVCSAVLIVQKARGVWR